MMTDTTRTPASGRFVLRINPGLHATLRASAARAGLSLNEFVARALAIPPGGAGGPAGEVVAHLVSMLGPRLAAVAVFGSWTRGELADESDVDVLVVVDQRAAVTRALYRRWDRAPRLWEGRRVEPHFVQLPPGDAPTDGLWAEVAIEGVILYDPHLVLSLRLATIRRAIADGRLVRRRTHGQTYWVEAA